MSRSGNTEAVGGCLILAVWLVSVLGSIGVTVGLVYAAFHFIRKFW